MHETINIPERKPVWQALSELYLDTQLQEPDLQHIARILLESPYTWPEVQHINRYEVFPVLLPNLLHIGGVWTGFEENRLTERITSSLEKRNAWRTWWLAMEYRAFAWMQQAEWAQLEKVYLRLEATQRSKP